MQALRSREAWGSVGRMRDWPRRSGRAGRTSGPTKALAPLGQAQTRRPAFGQRGNSMAPGGRLTRNSANSSGRSTLASTSRSEPIANVARTTRQYVCRDARRRGGEAGGRPGSS